MISIVVCTYNGNLRIRACISALIAQENPPEFEILIVDNASSDGTGSLAQSFLNANFSSGSWKVIREDRPGLLYARMAGLKEARHDWVLFCDDDNVLFPDFLFQCQQVLSKNDRIGVLGSHGIPEFLGPKPDWFDRFSSSYAVGPQLGDGLKKRHLVYVYGACSIFRKKPLMKIFDKGFTPALSDRIGSGLLSGGDVEWCWLMQLMGYKVAYSVKLRFNHQLPASRLTWEYYIRLKQGISGSAGILFPYEFYFSHSLKSKILFILKYSLKLIASSIRYYRYRILWKGNPSKPEDQLAFSILESRSKAYLGQGNAAISHFDQLKRYFGS